MKPSPTASSATKSLCPYSIPTLIRLPHRTSSPLMSVALPSQLHRRRRVSRRRQLAKPPRRDSRLLGSVGIVLSKAPCLSSIKIVDFCDFLSPTPEEQAARNTAVERVSDVVKHIWPHSKVEVFGSFKTGLYLPSSDIDVVILGSGLQIPQKGLVALSRALSQRGLAKNIQVIGKARVPIVKFVEKKSGVAFDISFDVQNGPLAAVFIKVYSGGIGSYALLAMLMAMLQSLPKSQAAPEHNLGILLAPENDIGKNSFNYFQIRSAFAMAFTTLTNPKIIMDLGPNRSILGTIIRPDPVLLERKGGSNGDVTFNSLLPGAGEPLQHQYGEQQEILCNWQLGDEEEPLPRANYMAGESSRSSGKKRKASSKEKTNKKAKENGGELGKVRHEENGSRKENGVKKKRWRHNRDSSHSVVGRSSNGYGHYVGGSPWSR
ncbi:non-canonical poly(a) rna polymerase papd5 [Quercus suber]|uniref:polynucleotide adenylyltransferase n=1 Tax=Quercus suber TaxID=58331 RepID=A0AAW0M1I4_QUESU